MPPPPKGAESDKLATQRQLKIKVGATKRLLKEHKLYRNEAEEHQRKVDRAVAENGEEWEIKNAKRIFEESQRMIRDSGDRLHKAVQELSTLVESVESRSELAQDEELLRAKQELAEASAALELADNAP